MQKSRELLIIFHFERKRKKGFSLFLSRSRHSQTMDSPCDYEEERARRIAENMKRLAELGVVEVSERPFWGG